MEKALGQVHKTVIYQKGAHGIKKIEKPFVSG